MRLCPFKLFQLAALGQSQQRVDRPGMADVVPTILVGRAGEPSAAFALVRLEPADPTANCWVTRRQARLP